MNQVEYDSYMLSLNAALATGALILIGVILFGGLTFAVIALIKGEGENK